MQARFNLEGMHMYTYDTDYPTDMMTLDELRRRLGISSTTAYELANRDELPFPVIRVGRRFLFSRKLFDDMLRGQQRLSPARDAA
jgi:excisionase family DNA binding protein